MLESDTKDFELTELDAPEEELLGRYLPIGDVAKSIGVNPSVLRFWEQEFPQLRPTKRGNRRYYCSEDVALIRTIQHLLYEEHYTILGARNKIHELQIQNKVKGILDEKASAPLQIKPQEPVLDLAATLAELKAIRAILDSPALEESRRQEQQAKEKAERDAVENFALESEDLNELLAREAEEEASEAEASENEAAQQEEVTAPHSYDLGAIGVDSDDFLQPSPKIGDMSTTSEKKEEKVTKAERPKVDTSHLVVPPLPGERHGFTVGMKVPKNQEQSLTYTSAMVWKKK
ncbi:MAG TPA: MerR family transcriptional regulator [Candidatus Aphodousia faecigallinarum]|uniref:MerR family transcriptional regulator n=1 Tax=Candidatus Aphodousia faecigallinarum TaxID=2840677 RepID=A0A9D1IGR2_9BURK|nr:MerR family transcriptional regulator [Candidatus Aphodousia faecigallinarum]